MKGRRYFTLKKLLYFSFKRLAGFFSLCIVLKEIKHPKDPELQAQAPLPRKLEISTKVRVCLGDSG